MMTHEQETVEESTMPFPTIRQEGTEHDSVHEESLASAFEVASNSGKENNVVELDKPFDPGHQRGLCLMLAPSSGTQLQEWTSSCMSTSLKMDFLERTELPHSSGKCASMATKECSTHGDSLNGNLKREEREREETHFQRVEATFRDATFRACMNTVCLPHKHQGRWYQTSNESGEEEATEMMPANFYTTSISAEVDALHVLECRNEDILRECTRDMEMETDLHTPESVVHAGNSNGLSHPEGAQQPQDARDQLGLAFCALAYPFQSKLALSEEASEPRLATHGALENDRDAIGFKFTVGSELEPDYFTIMEMELQEGTGELAPQSGIVEDMQLEVEKVGSLSEVEDQRHAARCGLQSVECAAEPFSFAPVKQTREILDPPTKLPDGEVADQEAKLANQMHNVRQVCGLQGCPREAYHTGICLIPIPTSKRSQRSLTKVTTDTRSRTDAHEPRQLCNLTRGPYRHDESDMNGDEHETRPRECQTTVTKNQSKCDEESTGLVLDNLSAMTAKRIRKLLAKHNVKPSSETRKSDLIRLLEAARIQHQKDKEQAELVKQLATNKAAIYGVDAKGDPYLSEEDDLPFVERCDLCSRILMQQERWFKCMECVNFDVCGKCRSGGMHPHTLVQRGDGLKDLQLLEAVWCMMLDFGKIARSMECSMEQVATRLKEMTASLPPSAQAFIPRLSNVTSTFVQHLSSGLHAQDVSARLTEAEDHGQSSQLPKRQRVLLSVLSEEEAVRALAALQPNCLLEADGWENLKNSVSSIARVTETSPEQRHARYMPGKGKTAKSSGTTTQGTTQPVHSVHETELLRIQGVPAEVHEPPISRCVEREPFPNDVDLWLQKRLLSWSQNKSQT